MEASDALRVLSALDEHAVRYWVAGGWGVDALCGKQTRAHRDLDLAVDDVTMPPARAALATLGFAPQTDWLPVRLELASGPGGWVDLHPVRFDSAGNGRQEGLDGAWFDYPATALVHGRIGSRTVRCISAALQREFHSGYDPRPQDLHDLALLAELADRRRQPDSDPA